MNVFIDTAYVYTHAHTKIQNKTKVPLQHAFPSLIFPADKFGVHISDIYVFLNIVSFIFFVG